MQKIVNAAAKAIYRENIPINQEVEMEIPAKDNFSKFGINENIGGSVAPKPNTRTAVELEILHYINDKITDLNCLKDCSYTR